MASNQRQGTNPVSGKSYVNYGRAITWTDGRQVRLQIATDITEIKRLEDELRQKYKLEAVGLLAGGMAHNFNNSLGVILGNVELSKIKLTSAPEEAGNLLDNAKQAILHTRNLVKQVLTYSRQSMHDKNPLQLSLAVDETMKLLRSTIPSSVVIDTRIASDLPLIQADASQIQEALINLCNNALHAMNEKGMLSVRLDHVRPGNDRIPTDLRENANDYVRLEVEDTGRASATKTSTKSSTRSLPPRTWIREPGWGCRPYRGSSTSIRVLSR